MVIARLSSTSARRSATRLRCASSIYGQGLLCKRPTFSRRTALTAPASPLRSARRRAPVASVAGGMVGRRARASATADARCALAACTSPAFTNTGEFGFGLSVRDPCRRINAVGGCLERSGRASLYSKAACAFTSAKSRDCTLARLTKPLRLNYSAPGPVPSPLPALVRYSASGVYHHHAVLPSAGDPPAVCRRA